MYVSAAFSNAGPSCKPSRPSVSKAAQLCSVQWDLTPFRMLILEGLGLHMCWGLPGAPFPRYPRLGFLDFLSRQFTSPQELAPYGLQALACPQHGQGVWDEVPQLGAGALQKQSCEIQPTSTYLRTGIPLSWKA